MSEGPDGRQDGPAESIRRSGRPPVPPRPVPADGPAAPAGQHPTERIPLPPSTAGVARGDHQPEDEREEEQPVAPRPVAAPETGQLDLGSYPPRVPGRPRPGREDAGSRPDDDGRGAPGGR
jgi:hypothetical protein